MANFHPIMKISLIVPTRNSEKTIEECLKSVDSMNFKPQEIIIVDGESEDKTIEKARKFQVKIVRGKKGLAFQRNQGAKESNSDYLAFLDSDVKVDPTWLKVLAGLLEKNKDIVAAGGQMIEKYTDTRPDKWRNSHMSQNWGEKRELNPRFLFGSNFIIRKKTLQDIGFFNEKLLTNYEDVDLFNRLKKANAKFVYEPLAKCYHLKKDTIKSIMKTNFNWQLFAYPLPDNLINMILKIIVFNPYKTFVYFSRDLIKLRLDNIPLDILMYFFHTYYDIKYFFSKN